MKRAWISLWAGQGLGFRVWGLGFWVEGLGFIGFRTGVHAGGRRLKLELEGSVTSLLVAVRRKPSLCVGIARYPSIHISHRALGPR